jgi:hypothetical protein
MAGIYGLINISGALYKGVPRKLLLFIIDDPPEGEVRDGDGKRLILIDSMDRYVD